MSEKKHNCYKNIYSKVQMHPESKSASIALLLQCHELKLVYSSSSKTPADLIHPYTPARSDGLESSGANLFTVLHGEQVLQSNGP